MTMQCHTLKPALVIVGCIGWLAVTGAAADVITVRGTDSSITMVAELAEAYRQLSGNPVTVEGGGSTRGPVSCLANGVELAFVARDLNDKERGAGLVGFSYAIDGVVVIVNPDNPVDQLTLVQLRDIFAGQTRSWNNGKPIVAYCDGVISAVRDCFTHLVMEGQKLGAAVRMNEDQSAFTGVIQNPMAIGFIPAAIVAEDPQLKIVKIDGAMPSPWNLRDGHYPIRRTFTLVTRGQPTEAAMAFIDFVLSQEGQQIIRDAGLLPVETQPASQIASAVAAWH